MAISNSSVFDEEDTGYGTEMFDFATEKNFGGLFRALAVWAINRSGLMLDFRVDNLFKTRHMEHLKVPAAFWKVQVLQSQVLSFGSWNRNIASGPDSYMAGTSGYVCRGSVDILIGQLAAA